MINNRINDCKVEREIASFLEAALYNDEPFIYFERTDDKERQLQGSDVILSTYDGILNNAIVDEKVASRFANTDLNTFALELSFLGKNGALRMGWLLDENKTTQYYLFGWILKADIPYIEKIHRYDTNLITGDKIKEFEWMIVPRQSIIDFLSEKGWTRDRLLRQDAKIRENGKVNTKAFIDDISFRYSDMYVEKPINLLLKKETYRKLSIYSGILNVVNPYETGSEEAEG